MLYSVELRSRAYVGKAGALSALASAGCRVRSACVRGSFHYRSDSYRIQTYNLLIRSQMLYSVELRSRFSASLVEPLSVSVCKGTAFFETAKSLW